jgi:SAM-dependent methyltransferase
MGHPTRRGGRALDVWKADRPSARRGTQLDAVDLDVVALTRALEQVVERAAGVAEAVGPVGNDNRRLELHASSIARPHLTSWAPAETPASRAKGEPVDAPQAGAGILATMSQENYLLARQPSELERLRLQSLVWEPTGRQLLSKVGGGSGGRALDVGCGAMGWLRILREWVGPSGQIVGADVDESMLNAARSFLEAEGISNVELVVDDLFDSKLERQSFDLVHARYLIAPLGRGREQVASHRRLVKPGGSLVLEEWDLASWHFNPTAPAAERLIRLLSEIFAGLGGEAGRGLPELLREIGIEEPGIDAHVIALPPGHPYLRLPLQFSVALESRLLETLSEDELASLRREAESELAEPGRWGTTFTLIQSWGRLEG